MHLSPDVHVEWVEGEAVALNAGSGEFHYLNPSAALALALITEHGVEGAAAELKAKHSDDPQMTASEFSDFVDDLLEKGLLLR